MSQTKAQLISDLVQALNFTGTASAPANGVFLSATNTLAFATNSGSRITIDSSGNLNIPNDSGKLRFGTGSDLEMFHTGTSSKINNATGSLLIQSDATSFHGDGGSETMATLAKNGAVELYFDNDRKFRTVSSGCQVESTTGDTFLVVRSEEDDASSDAFIRLQVENTSATSGVLFGDSADGDIGQILYEHADNSMRFRTNTAEQWRITSAGHLENNNDTGRIKLGTSDDLQIYHDGTHSYIANSTGNLYVNAPTFFHLGVSNGGEKYLTATENGAVELYHDNSKKFETISYGAKVTGEIEIDSGHLRGDSTNGLRLFSDSTALTGITLTTDDDLVPQTNNAQDLGTSSLRYRDIFVANDINISDNGEIRLGDATGGDIVIKHTTSDNNSHIENHTGDLVITTKGAGDDIKLLSQDDVVIRDDTDTTNMAAFIQGGAVELYHDNSKKFETTSGGVLATGDVDSTTGIFEHTTNFTSQLKFNSSNETKLIHASNNQVKLSFVGLSNAARGSIDGQSGFIRIKTGADETGIICRDNSSTDLHFDGSKKLETQSSGVTLLGDLFGGDNIVLRLGNATGGDLQIYHTGTTSFIDNATSELRIRSQFIALQPEGGGEQMAFGTQGGAFELYHDGVKKFETKSDGVMTLGRHQFANDSGSSGGFTHCLVSGTISDGGTFTAQTHNVHAGGLVTITTNRRPSGSNNKNISIFPIVINSTSNATLGTALSSMAGSSGASFSVAGTSQGVIVTNTSGLDQRVTVRFDICA